MVFCGTHPTTWLPWKPIFHFFLEPKSIGTFFCVMCGLGCQRLEGVPFSDSHEGQYRYHSWFGNGSESDLLLGQALSEASSVSKTILIPSGHDHGSFPAFSSFSTMGCVCVCVCVCCPCSAFYPFYCSSWHHLGTWKS